MGFSEFGGSIYTSHKMSGSRVEKISPFDWGYTSDTRSSVISVDAVRETSLFQDMSGIYIHDHHDGHGLSSLVRAIAFGAKSLQCLLKWSVRSHRPSLHA